MEDAIAILRALKEQYEVHHRARTVIGAATSAIQRLIQDHLPIKILEEKFKAGADPARVSS